MKARHRSSFPVMGTTASVHVNDDVSIELFESFVRELRDELERLEQMFSVFRPSSEISRINRAELNILDASQEVLDVLDACTWLEQASRNAFLIRPDAETGHINPTGFVKGWAAERASRLFSDHGLEHWYLGVGGDYVMAGGMDPDTPWTIGIIDPRDPTMLVGDVSVFSGAVATSGTSERGSHLWASDGFAAESPFLSVTVTGPSLTWADAFATTVFVMGEAGPEWLAQFENYDVLPVRVVERDDVIDVVAGC